MSNRFAISDHHSAHAGIYSFKYEAGELIRPWASSADEAGERLIDPRYLNICIEAIGLRPLPLEAIERRLESARYGAAA